MGSELRNANQDARVVSHNLLHPEDPVTIRQDVVPPGPHGGILPFSSPAKSHGS